MSLLKIGGKDPQGNAKGLNLDSDGNIISGSLIKEEVLLDDTYASNPGSKQITLNKKSSLLIAEVEGDFDGNFQIKKEVNDGDGYVDHEGFDSDGEKITTISESGRYFIDCTGLHKIQFATAWNSGTIKLTAIATNSGLVDAYRKNETYSTTQDKEVSAYIYEQIIDEIGLQNILMFVPAWEGEGDTLRDLINPAIEFKSENPPSSMRSDGILHPVPHRSYPEDADRFNQVPETESLTTGGSANLQSGDKLAQKVKDGSLGIGFTELKLKIIGSLSSSVTLKASIYADDFGSVGSLISEGYPIKASDIGSSFGWQGFPLNEPTSQGSTGRWIVLEWHDENSEVDGSNYIQWEYDNGTNDYSEARASFDGSSWTATSGENHVFKLYNDALQTPDDFTIITAQRNTYTEYSSSRGKVIRFANPDYDHFSLNSSEYVRIRARDPYIGFSGQEIMGRLSFKELTIRNYITATSFAMDSAGNEKFKGYFNGVQIDDIDSGNYAGSRFRPQWMPVSLFYLWTGVAGPFIITKNVLTQESIAKITNLLLTQRRLKRNNV